MLVLNLVMALLAVVVLLPLAVILSWSLKSNAEIFSLPVNLVPIHPTSANYQVLFQADNFVQYFRNSLIVSVGYTTLGLVWCAMGGWALSHYRTRVRGPLLILLIATVALPFQILVIPVFVLVVNLGIVDTLTALIVPFSASAYGILFMRQYMLSVPHELVEAARLDGASEPAILLRIAVPITFPALAALGIFLFLDAWNDYLWPLIALLSNENYTVPLAMAGLVTYFKVQFGPLMASAALALVPVAAVLLFLQRQFVAGITAGAVRR